MPKYSLLTAFLELFENFLVDFYLVLLSELLDPFLLEGSLIVGDCGSAHVGRFFRSGDDTTVEGSIVSPACLVAVVGLGGAEAEIVGDGVLALGGDDALNLELVAELPAHGGSEFGGNRNVEGLCVFERFTYDGIIVGEEDEALELGLVPLVLGDVLVEECLETFGIFRSFVPYVVVGDFIEKDAVAVLVDEVAVVGVCLKETRALCLENGVVECGSRCVLEHLHCAFYVGTHNADALCVLCRSTEFCWRSPWLRRQ